MGSADDSLRLPRDLLIELLNPDGSPAGIAVACPFCGLTVAFSPAGIAHRDPICRTFDRLDAGAYQDAVVKALEQKAAGLPPEEVS